MSTKFNFLLQNPLKFVLSGYFRTENFISNKWGALLKNVNAPEAFIREYTVIEINVENKRMLTIHRHELDHVKYSPP